MYVYVCYLLNAPNSRGNKTVNQHNPCVTMTVMTKGVHKCRDESNVIGCFFISYYQAIMLFKSMVVKRIILTEHRLILEAL